MERVILHVDLNHFYAAVECLHHPSYRHVPLIVSGNPKLRHGIVLAKNELAKKYGIQTGEAIWQAKEKCPDLVAVLPSYRQYLRFSQMVKEIYASYTDQIEPFGIDECWLDVSGSARLFGGGVKIADEIRARIQSETGITASVGVSYNKIFAKLGSDYRKPNATTEITQANKQTIVDPLPVQDLLYVGNATKRKLLRYGIQTIGELSVANDAFLLRLLGKMGLILKAFAIGEDMSAVSNLTYHSQVKSVGNSLTAPHDLQTDDDLRILLYMLCESVAARLREQVLSGDTVTLYVRDATLACSSHQTKLQYTTHIAAVIATHAHALFVTNYNFQIPIRSLGVKVSGIHKTPKDLQLSLFEDRLDQEKQKSLEIAVDSIRRRFGNHSVQRAIALQDKVLSQADIKEDHVIFPVTYFK